MTVSPTGSFQEEFSVTLLDANDQIIRPLYEYTGGGSLEQNMNRTIRGGGSIDVRFIGTPKIDFGSDRVQIHRHVRGQKEPLSLGIYLIEAPTMNTNDENEVVDTTLSLLDKLAILDQDEIFETFGVGENEVVTDVVGDIIESATTSKYSIEKSSKTMNRSKTWEPGTSKLDIINDLLESINYFSLWANKDGIFIGEPYLTPDKRSVSHVFEYGPRSLHKPQRSVSQDWFAIPNQIVLHARGDGEDEGLTAVWRNEDPESPYSIPSRGRVISLTEDADSVDQETLDALAARRGVDVSSKVTNITVEHAIMDIWPNDLVELVTPVYEGSATVSKWSLSLEPGAQMQATWREVSRAR